MHLCDVFMWHCTLSLFRALRTVSRRPTSVTHCVYRKTRWSSNTRKQNRQFSCSIVSSLTLSFASCAAASCFKCIFLNRACSQKYVCRSSLLISVFRWESWLNLVHCIALVMCHKYKLKTSHVALVTPDHLQRLIFFYFTCSLVVFCSSLLLILSLFSCGRLS